MSVPSTCCLRAETTNPALSPVRSPHPIQPGNQLTDSVKRLKKHRSDFERAYGKDWAEDIELWVGSEQSKNLSNLADFAKRGLEDLEK